MSFSTVYKLCVSSEWEIACREGLYEGSDTDRRDGFVHLSFAHQVAASAARYFRGCETVLLIALDAVSLGERLRYEPSRGGESFPHLYAPLATAQAPNGPVLWVEALKTDRDGIPQIGEICV
jgi:uncharacterized protein (DUF952 family)